MRRFATIALLVMSPLNGLWLFCPPSEASVRPGASQQCQRVCPAERADTICLASSEKLMVSPAVDVAVAPVLPEAGPSVPQTIGEAVADVSATLHDRAVAPSIPPPKA